MTLFKPPLSRLIFTLAITCPSLLWAGPKISWQPRPPAPGQPLLIQVSRLEPQTSIEGRLGSTGLNFFPAGKGKFLSLTGIDLENKDKDISLELALTSHSGSVQRIQRQIRLGQKDYGVQRLTLPSSMVKLDEKTLVRVKQEARRLERLWGQISQHRLWQARFILPVAAKVTSLFGLRGIINGQERSPHSGIDIATAVGTPVKATNSGRVVFVDDLFFSGNTLVIDHGQGIFTMYFHLESVALRKGQLVKRGQILGRVGRTGRVTGPNLHWGVRINRARVDPLTLIRLPLP